MAKGHYRRNQRDNDKFSYRTNNDIRVPQVRLVGDDLEEISGIVGETIEVDVYPTSKVREWAQKAELDVVEISPKAKPPVVKILDYNKFLYDQKKREKKIKKNAQKTVVKEIRFGPNTDEHDFEFKLNHAKSFLEEGAKVRAYVHFKGRSIVFKERGELLLLRFLKELEELGSAEALPRMEGRRMSVIVSPKKKKS